MVQSSRAFNLNMRLRNRTYTGYFTKKHKDDYNIIMNNSDFYGNN